MIRKKSPISAGLSVDEAVSKVAAEPLMVVSGVRSSWLTMPKNSARSRCRSSSGVMSCTVATTDTTAPSSEKIGVAFTTVVTAWPSGSCMMISLGAHGLAAFQRPFRWHFRERNLTSIRTPEGQYAEDFRLATTRCAEPADNPPRLLIERHEIARLRVKDRDAHGHGVDQGLQVVLGPMLLRVSAGVDNGHSRLGGEHDEGLFVFQGELPSALLLGQVDIAEALA